MGFYGNGYLEHSSYTLRKISSSMSFSFRTLQEETILLLSTFQGQEERLYSSQVINEDITVMIICYSTNFVPLLPEKTLSLVNAYLFLSLLVFSFFFLERKLLFRLRDERTSRGSIERWKGRARS